LKSIYSKLRPALLEGKEKVSWYKLALEAYFFNNPASLRIELMKKGNRQNLLSLITHF